MRSHQKFHTETKEPIPVNVSGYHKPSQHSMFNVNLLKKPSLSSFKHLTIRVYEAKLLVDVSIFGKMHTYTKIKLGSFLWQTNLNKESHMNPKWNESKIFDLTNIWKSVKGLEPSFGNPVPKDGTHRKWNSSQGMTTTTPNPQQEDTKINITVYHKGFLHDVEIGQIIVCLKDLVKAKSTSEWFVLQNKKEIVGSILLSFEFEDPEDDFLSALSKAPSGHKVHTSNGSWQLNDTRAFSKPSSRLATESNRPSKSPIFEKKRIFPGSQTHSYNSSINAGKRPDSSVPKFQGYSSHQSTDYDYLGQASYQGGVKKNQRDLSRGGGGGGNRSHLPKASKPEEREREVEVANTLITYEYHHEDDNAYGDKQQSYENFFNSRSSDGEEGSGGSDVTDCDIRSEQADEGSRQMDTHDDGSDHMKSEEVKRVLEGLKKENIDIKKKDKVLKEKLRAMELEFERVHKEKLNIKSREEALILRENCIKNERKNLAIEFNNLRGEQEKTKNCSIEINDLRRELSEAKREEEMYKTQTLELENKVKEMSYLVQRETQSLKQFEQEMYKQLIARKVTEMQSNERNRRDSSRGLRSRNSSNIPPQVQEEKGFEVREVEKPANLNVLMSNLRHQGGNLAEEIEMKSKYVNQLKKMIKDYDKENIAENRF